MQIGKMTVKSLGTLSQAQSVFLKYIQNVSVDDKDVILVPFSK